MDNRRQQQGAIVLFFSITLLICISILTLGSLQTMPFKVKVTEGVLDRNIAYESAQGAIIQAQRFIADTDFSLNSFITDLPCTENCFNVDCHSGLCADVDYVNGGQCHHNEQTIAYWDRESIWDNSSTHRTANVSEAATGEAKYIIEFLCFMSSDPSAPPPPPGVAYGPGWASVFRVTAKGLGKFPNTYVQVQSTISKPW